jgi:hypothetical protein
MSRVKGHNFEMKLPKITVVRAILLAGALLAVSRTSFAQTDEIQVYDAEIEEVGKFNVMVHNNFTPIGRKQAGFPGGIIPNDSDNGAVEWAYGVKPWMEQGLYFPVYSAYSKGRGGSLNGFKIRELFVRPDAHQHEFFYGVNFEFSVNYTYWEPRHITSEIRPIIGTHLGKFDLIYNPIMDTEYRGGFGGLEFVPAGRIAYNLNDKWAVAAEEYDDFGTFHDVVKANEQFHEVWAVMDHNSKIVNIEAGVGVGVTDGADKLTLKLMLSRDLN